MTDYQVALQELKNAKTKMQNVTIFALDEIINRVTLHIIAQTEATQSDYGTISKTIGTYTKMVKEKLDQI